MSRIRGNNLKPEESLAAEFGCRGVWVTRNDPLLPGTPDFVLARYRLAVFVHGCYWHGCQKHYRAPKTNRRFWRKKIEDNTRRDSRVRRQLRAKGYRTTVVWEHDLRKGARFAADRILRRARGAS